MSEQVNREKSRLEILLVKAVDGELSEAEAAEFEMLLHSNPAYAKEWQEMIKLKEVTQMMQFKQPAREVWDTYWLHVYNRLERGLAWIAISLGATILLAYGLYHLAIEMVAFLTDSTAPFFLRIGIVAVVIGLAILIISVLREKLTAAKHDPYKEVKR